MTPKNKKLAKKPKKKHLLIGVSVLIVSVFVIFKYIIPEINKSNQIEEAESIVSRAKEIALYIPDTTDRRLILHTLQRMKVYQSSLEKNGSVNLPPGENIALVIIDFDRTDAQKESKEHPIFGFLDKALFESNVILVSMNRNIADFSDDIDAKSVALIHELVHFLQVIGPKKHWSVFQKEVDAWNCQTFLYLAVHPELKEATCNCNDFSMPEDPRYKNDALIQSMIRFGRCRENYLKTLYDPNQ